MKLRQRRVFAELEVPGVGFRLEAVAGRGDLDDGEVAFLESALRLRAVVAGLVAQALHHGPDVGVGDVDLRLFDLEPAVLAESMLGSPSSGP